MERYNIYNLAYKMGRINPIIPDFEHAPLNTINEDNIEGNYWYHQPSKTLYFNFLASNEPEDWTLNFRVAKTKVYLKSDVNKYVKLHSGFLYGYVLIRHIILQNIEKYNPERIVFSGFSFGGAIAQIASALIKDQFRHIFIECTTFGSPKVGGIDFRRLMAKVDYTRLFVLGFDLAPRLPFTFPILLGSWWYSKRDPIKLGSHPQSRPWSFWKDHYPLRYQKVIEDTGWKYY